MPGIPLYFPSDILSDSETPQLNKKRLPFKIFISSLIIVLGAFGLWLFTQSSDLTRIVHLKETHADFIGREEYLESLKQICLHKKTDVSVAVLWGEGGIGKSEIAIAFANKYSKHFSVIYWIDCATEESYREGYYQLASSLNIPLNQKEGVLEVAQKVHRQLEKQTCLHPWLLIYDNAEKYMDLPQRGKGAIILTTRNQIHWPTFPCLEVTSFSGKEAWDLLTTITQEKDTDWLPLAQELDYFPLALNLAAHYIAETPGMTKDKYLQLLSENKIALIDSMPVDSRYPNHLVASWKITADQLQEKYPEVLAWLHFCAYLSPDGIPFSWINIWLARFGQYETQLSRDLKANDILRILVNQAFMRYHKNTKKLSLHRIKQELFKQDQYFDSEIKREVLEFLLNEIKGLERIDELERHMESWPKLKEWEVHAAWFLNHHADSVPKEKLALLQNMLGSWKSVIGDDNIAKIYIENALKTRLELIGKKDPSIPLIMNNLGWTLMRVGQFQESKDVFTHAIKVAKKLYGQEHPEVAILMNNLTLVLKWLGEFEKMKSVNESVLAMRKKFYPEDHPYIADTMHNLACALWKLNQIDQAHSYYEKALSIYKKAYGEEHSFSAIALHNVARFFSSQKKYEESEKCFEEALNLYIKLYRKEHCYVAICMDHLGDLMQEQGKHQKALSHYKEAFVIYCQVYGKEHPYLIQALDHLIQSLKQAQNRTSIPKIRKEIYPLCLEVLGEKHQLTQTLITLAKP